MRIFAVRIGKKFGQDVEDYINSKLPNVTWIRDSLPGVNLQWNKMRVMNMDIDEPVVVIDIDLEFINDYMDAFEYPIERGEFLSAKSWWRDTARSDLSYSVNGGFFKYYPKDCKYIYDKFMKDKFYWQNYYIKNGTTVGPVNGEQYFVEDSVKEKLKLKFLPETWFCKSVKNPSKDWWARMNTLYPGDWLYLDGEYNKEIKIIHEMFGGKYQNLPSRSI
tara:strand:- start:3767 stop:4423 length:657 start_codon:yes stop_codon:yes gene_type:complete